MKKLGLKSYFKNIHSSLSFRVKRSETEKSVRKDYNKSSLFLRSLHFGRDDKNKNGRSSIGASLRSRLLRMTGVVIFLVLILSLIPILSNIKQSSKSNAEQVGSSPNNSSTSTIKSLYDNLVTLNHGTDTNTPDLGTYWNRIITASTWLPNNDNNPTNLAQASDVCQGKLFYAGDRTIKTGTKNCPVVPGADGANTRGGDIYITGTGFTTSTIAQVGGEDCQATKFISSTKLRCTIPPKNHNTTHNITVTTAGTADPNQTVTYNNNSQGNMQDFTSTECNNLQRGQAIVLTDTRISKGETQPRTYRVKKMADDKCWMIDNLRYADNSWTEPGTNQYMTNDGTSTQSSTNSDVYRYKNPGSSTSGCSQGSSIDCYGYLYNWYTATGGTGLYSVSTSGQNVTGNICPNDSNSTNTNPASNKWQLPTGGGSTTQNSTYNSDLAILNSAIHDDTGDNDPPTTGLSAYSNASQHPTYYPLWQPNNSFQDTFSGYYDSSLFYQGSYGYYWPSTAYSSNYARALYFNSSSVGPGSVNYVKNYGFAVRCLIH